MIPRLLLTINLAGSAVLGAQTAGPDGLTGGRALIITHATIVDTRGGPLRNDMSVVIRGDRIVSIAPTGSDKQRIESQMRPF